LSPVAHRSCKILSQFEAVLTLQLGCLKSVCDSPYKKVILMSAQCR